MPNGEMLDELRKLAATPGEISQDASSRLTLSALAEIFSKITLIISDARCREDMINDLSDQLVDVENKMIDDVGKVNSDVVKILKVISNNPLVEIGAHIRDHPKLTWVYFTLIFILMNVWFVPEVRRLFLLGVGIDPAIVNILVSP